MRSLVLSTLVCLTMAAPIVTAQTNTAEIQGVVKDALGGVLRGATVSVLHLPTGLRVERTSDENGRFFMPSLPLGEYRITVALDGFKTVTRTGTVLQVGQTVDLPIVLPIGEQTESVTVSGVTPILQTTSAEISGVIRNQMVVELPLNGRQFVQLAQLSEGVVLPPGGTRGAALEQSGALPAVLGQRNGHNIYLLDGVKVTDEFFNNLVVSPSVEAIQEFKIQKTLYPAEFGGKSSALINVVTKSGSNQLVGSALEFLRNDGFDAHNAFDDPTQPVPPLRQHQFGGSVGGPLRPDRAFFFLSYEGQRVVRSLTQTFSVPPTSLRRGNFAGLGALCDPLTRTATGCTPFTGNQIPAARFDPVALALLQKVPEPSTDGSVQNLVAVGAQNNPVDQFTVRVDHRLSDNDMIFGRFTAYRASDSQPFGTSSLNEALVPGFGRLVTTKSRNIALSHTHVFSPSALNELRFGWLSVSGGQESPNQGIDFAAMTGLRGVTSDPADMGYPQVSFGGLFSTIGDPSSFVSRDNRSVELYDNLLLGRGDHHLKFGGYLFHLSFNPVNPTAARGVFTFNGQWTGNAFADFLLGYPSAAQVGLGRADEHGHTTWLHVYGQDDWKIRSNLTVNYGLRYEINGQMTDDDNRLSAIDLSVPGGRFVIASDDSGAISQTARPLLSEIPIPYTTSRDAGWTPGLLRPSYLRFAPRVGMALTLGRADTVVTAGFGVFLNQWAYSVQQSFSQTLPFFFGKTVNAAADAIQPTATTGTMLLAPATGSIGGSTMNHDYRTEYAKTVVLGLQRQLTTTTALDVSYLASWIVGADSSTVLNVPEPGPGPIGPRRPVPQLSNIATIRWDGFSRFHGLTVKAEQRLSRGISVSANYMLSKAVDDASDPGVTTSETNLPQDVRTMAGELAPASFDHRQRLVATLSYALPNLAGAHTGFLPALGAGWRVNGIVTLQSGAPFTVNLGVDRANIGSGPAQRPNELCDPNDAAPRTAEQWFNTQCFSLPDPFTFGSAGRNSVVGPGYANVDFAVAKSVSLANRARLELRWETFNLLNRVNYDVPNRIYGSPNFGRIFSAGPARQMQFGLKVLF